MRTRIGPCGERALSARCGGDCVSCAGERDEERIALGVDLGAAVIGECLPEHLAMARQSLRIGIAELLQQPRRPLDVGEEEGDGAGRQLGHAGQVNRVGDESV